MIKNNVHCCLNLLLFTSIFVSLTAATSDYLEGCSHFPSTSEQCFVNDVEVLPQLYTRESGIIYDIIESVEGCQLECTKNIDCQYFTFRKHKTDGTVSCHLKPAPGYNTSPIMVIRKFDSDSVYSYTSGPRQCGDKCKEEAEVHVGCGGSSPASCASFDHGFFSTSCLDNPDADNCGKFPYFKCCKKCIEEDCCTSTPDQIFSSKAESLSSNLSGIESKSHCQSLCLLNEKCQRWNYIASPSTAFIGGACYLTEDDGSVNENGQAPGWASESYVGSRLCTSPVDTSTCLQEGKRVQGHQLIDARNENKGEENCRNACRAWPGCSMIMMTGEDKTCNLLFGDGPIEDGGGLTWVERVPCTGKADTGCAVVGKALSKEGAISAGSQGPFVHSCLSVCHRTADCVAWSYVAENFECIISTKDDFVDSKDAISAKRDCKFPVDPWTRLLQAEIFDVPVLEEQCIHTDMTLDRGFIEFIGGSPSVQDCYQRCLDRPDCKALTYSTEGRICSIHWGGQFIEQKGTVAAQRACGECQGETCKTRELEAVEGQMMGLSMKDLGAPSTWKVNGNLVNFRDHRTWKGPRILTQPEDDKICSVGDTSMSCTTDLYPLEFRMQAIAVSRGSAFSGWDQIPWQNYGGVSNEEQTQFELFGQNIKVTAADYGVYNLNLNGQRQSKWPVDFTLPKDFYHGTIYIRIQSISSPEPFNVILCITGSDFPLSEVCSTTVSVPPYNV